MAKALIVGAGAIGRGYIPWELKNFEITFFDGNYELVSSLRERGVYKTFMSFGDRLDVMDVDSRLAYSDLNKIDLELFDIAFVCVGPRNVDKLPKELGKLTCKIYSLENDPYTVKILQDHLGKEDIYFGVPDVIASLTASAENLELDPNALHTENGVLYLEDHGDVTDWLKDLTPSIHWIDLDQMKSEWDAKLYLHNTPHCIAAFYGYVFECKYVHEALAIEEVSIILEGVVDEILQMLKILTNHEHNFMEEYAKKEIRRFSNNLLFDPIVRVAREPIRKLQPGGRLLGALRMCISAGISPVNLAKGIVVALKYNEKNDPDYPAMNKINNDSLGDFLSIHLGVQSDSAEGMLIQKAYEEYDI